MGFVIETMNNLKLEKQALKNGHKSECITKRNGWGVCDLKREWSYILSKTVDIFDGQLVRSGYITGSRSKFYVKQLNDRQSAIFLKM